jgi:hypothetical protein
MDYKELLKKYMKYCEPQLNAAEVIREAKELFNEQESAALRELEDQLLEEWLHG